LNLPYMFVNLPATEIHSFLSINKTIMKVLVDIRDNKGDFILELLNNFSFVKAKSISPAKAQLLEELKEAVENLNLVKQGKIKARPAKDLLDEL